MENKYLSAKTVNIIDPRLDKCRSIVEYYMTSYHVDKYTAIKMIRRDLLALGT